MIEAIALPCPFCGSQPVVFADEMGDYIVECISEACTTEPSTYPPSGSRNDAVGRWNQRSHEAAVRIAESLSDVYLRASDDNKSHARQAIRDWYMRLNTCERKAQRVDEADAKAAIQRLVARGNVRPSELHAYRCQYCERWHIGHQRAEIDVGTGAVMADEDWLAEHRDTWNGLSSGARDVLVQLCTKGPTEDGDLLSKAGRDELLRKDLAAKIVLARNEQGYQAATYLGSHAYRAGVIEPHIASMR